MTGLSATEFTLKQRGFIREGYYADIVLFNARTVSDIADFTNPVAISTGIQHVWVNGQLSYQSGDSNAATLHRKKGAGRFLKHRQD
jgi:N-acyl-D-amino-acid deacylase